MEKKLGKQIGKPGNKVIDEVGSALLTEKSTAKSGVRIKQVMARPVFVSANATKKELFRIARKNPNAKIFVVVNKSRKFIGYIHEDDLFLMLVPNELHQAIGVDLALELQKKFFAKTAKELMRRNELYCHENDDIMDVAISFTKSELNEMPVLNKKEQVVGVVTQGILTRHLKQND